MNETTTAMNGAKLMTNDFVASELNTIMESVKAFRRVYSETLSALKIANVDLTPEFENSLQGMKPIRVSVFVSTLAKAGLSLRCKLKGTDDPEVSISSVSKLSSILSAIHDNDEEGLIARRARMYEPTLIEAINQPGELSMPILIKIIQASGLELSVK